MMNDCLFCKIVKGEIPSYTVYEDEKVIVFLDINPNNDGHLLVIPKKHKANIYEMDDETLLYILNVIRTKFATLLKDKLAIDGLTISQNNDYGQEVKHFHIHVIPRYKNDKFPLKSDCSNVEEIYHKLVD